MRALLLVFASALALAQVPRLQFADLGDLPLTGGSVLRDCRLGYRTYGTLNAAKSNAILFPTWFSGKSEDLDGEIGSGRLADTDKYFVIAVDALGNGVSSSPSNRPGPFPAITIRDMVNAEHRLVTQHLGLTGLHAVVGISMGGMQTMEWMTAYPGFARLAVPLVGSPKLTSTDLLLWQAELSVIEAASDCRCDTRAAMKAVLGIHEFALTTPEYRARQTPPEKFEEFRAAFENAPSPMDSRDWAAQLRAMMAQDVSRNYGGSMEKAAAAVKAKTLIVVALQDHMVNPLPALGWARMLRAQVLELKGNCGHMATDCEAERVAPAVRLFLDMTKQ